MTTNLLFNEAIYLIVFYTYLLTVVEIFLLFEKNKHYYKKLKLQVLMV